MAELAEKKQFGITLEESQIPSQSQGQGFCDYLALIPLYFAKEGKVVMLSIRFSARKVIRVMRNLNSARRPGYGGNNR